MLKSKQIVPKKRPHQTKVGRKVNCVTFKNAKYQNVKYKNYFYVGTGILGLIGGYFYNSQRSIIYNDFNRPIW